MAERLDEICLYVVYCRPRDFPAEYVVRIHRIRNGEMAIDRDLFARGPDLARPE